MSDFNMLVHRNGASLHLKLMGELNQASARQVMHIIQHNLAGINRVFLHTNGLNKLCWPIPGTLWAYTGGHERFHQGGFYG